MTDLVLCQLHIVSILHFLLGWVGNRLCSGRPPSPRHAELASLRKNSCCLRDHICSLGMEGIRLRLLRPVPNLEFLPTIFYPSHSTQFIPLLDFLWCLLAWYSPHSTSLCPRSKAAICKGGYYQICKGGYARFQSRFHSLATIFFKKIVVHLTSHLI